MIENILQCKNLRHIIKLKSYLKERKKQKFVKFRCALTKQTSFSHNNKNTNIWPYWMEETFRNLRNKTLKLTFNNIGIYQSKREKKTTTKFY